MSDEGTAPSVAHYRFLPWVRQGFQPAAVTDVDGDASEAADGADTEAVDGFATTAVTLTAQANEDADGSVTPATATDATVDLRLYGPGDVIGIDSRQVVRTEPTPDTPDFLPNRFPFVEFDRADLPWLFSPVGADERGRARPWLTLVVVSKREGVTVGMPEDGPLPVLEIAEPARVSEELPSPADGWAWAHAQVMGEPERLYDDAWLEAELAGQSDLTVARLVAPRKLERGERYHACVVPTYEVGRLAGLGVDPEEAVDRSALAWSTDDATVRLPVYYRWEFATGRSGDFETLVRRLDPTLLPPTVGSRKLDVSAPGPDALAMTDDDPAATLELGGALTSPERDPPTYDPAMRSALRDLLNAPPGADDDGTPVVGPPTYGEWHAPAETVDGTGGDDAGWVAELNLNPHHRAAAGLGTGVVRAEQEELMASAWAQLGDIRRANRLLRGAQTSREASLGLHEDLFDGPAEAAVGRTSTLHSRVRREGETVARSVAAGRLPSVATEPAFRRLLRPGGPLARRLARVAGDGVGPGSVGAADLVAGLNAGTIGGDPTVGSPSVPDGMVGVDDVADALCDAAGRRLDYLADLDARGESYVDALVAAIDDREAALATVPVVPIDIVDTDGVVATISGATIATFGLDSVTIDLGDFGGVGSSDGSDGTDDGTEEPDDTTETTTVANSSSNPTVGGTAGPPVIDVPTDPPDSGDGTGDDGTDGDPADPDPGDDGESTAERRERLERERRVLVAELGRVSGGLAPDTLATALAPTVCDTTDTGIAGPGDSLPLADIAADLADALDPESTVPARVAERIDGVDDDALLGRPDALAPVVAVPEFPRPMYEALRDRSQDLLLPGVESIPRDSLGVLATNPAFVEAYMLGLNQELAGEFRWREYPTVPWGTYFRQFWDARGRVPAPESPEEEEALLDIDPVRQWNDGLDLGENRTLRRLLRDDPDGEVPASAVAEGATEGTVVLVVRGELLRRYPTATIYAVPAVVATDDAGDVIVDPATGEPVRRPTTTSTAPAEPEDADDRADGDADAETTGPEFPAFRGTLDPDITFLGFDLGIDAARGDPPAELTATTGDPGWFFVIEEAPGEPSFGLDRDPEATAAAPPTDSWNDLAWEHVLSDPDAGGYAVVGDGGDAATALDGVRIGAVEWGHNSAHQAYATWQRPVRIAVHADELLPPDADDEDDDGGGEP